MTADNQQPTKEYPYKGFAIPGFVMLVIMLVVVAACVLTLVNTDQAVPVTICVIVLVCAAVCLNGFTLVEPNNAVVTLFFGTYMGTVRRTGFYWINPFMTRRLITLRVNNIDLDPIKVNDLVGNPVMIGMVLVWKVRDTYSATFDVDNSGLNRMGALRNFVAIQGDAALRQVAGQYAYDNDNDGRSITLRSDGDEISQLLEDKLNERLTIAGIEVVEARINYLAYAPEIAAVMLRRQQASAIIAAREKIVEGAVSMVRMALNDLEEQQVVKLSDDRRADIVGNLLMVLCSDESARPVIPAE